MIGWIGKIYRPKASAIPTLHLYALMLLLILYFKITTFFTMNAKLTNFCILKNFYQKNTFVKVCLD